MRSVIVNYPGPNLTPRSGFLTCQHAYYADGDDHPLHGSPGLIMHGSHVPESTIISGNNVRKSKGRVQGRGRAQGKLNVARALTLSRANCERVMIGKFTARTSPTK